MGSPSSAIGSVFWGSAELVFENGLVSTKSGPGEAGDVDWDSVLESNVLVGSVDTTALSWEDDPIFVTSAVEVLLIIPEALEVEAAEVVAVVDCVCVCGFPRELEVVVAVAVAVESLANRDLAMALAALSLEFGISRLMLLHPSAIGFRKVLSKTARSGLQLKYMHARTVSRKAPFASLHKHMPFVGVQSVFEMHLSIQSGNWKLEVDETWPAIDERIAAPVMASRKWRRSPILVRTGGH